MRLIQGLAVITTALPSTEMEERLVKEAEVGPTEGQTDQVQDLTTTEVMATVEDQ